MATTSTTDTSQKAGASSPKPRLLTGDTPSGRLHIGHFVGSLENRVKLQAEYECYFLIANTHAFTYQADKPPQQIRDNVINVAIDYLASGIDPTKSVMFIESDVPAIFELTTLFSMLIPYSRLMRNPTIKDEIRDRGMGAHYSMGFLLYPIMQVADILAFRAEIVPVGEDQIPHLELTREIARRFNQQYCGVNPHIDDDQYVSAGGIFPIPAIKLGRVARLVGTGKPGPDGKLLKMSKSLNNAILLSDSPDQVRTKIMSMYTDPQRIRATDPGRVENNPLWIFHDTFNPDTHWVEEAKQRYQSGKIGDVECKKKLIEVLNAFLAPIYERRTRFAKDPAEVLNILRAGAERANTMATETLQLVKNCLSQVY